jgi:hypothetical protein
MPAMAFLTQIHRAGAGRVEIAIHPNEGCPGIHLIRRRIFRVRQATVKVARLEEPLPLGIVVGKAALMLRHTGE